jgi:thioredoxin-like negative regulator of GroEL
VDVVVGKLDVDDHPAIAERYGIQSIPTVLVFRGGKLAARSIGLVPIERLRKLLEAPAAEAEATAQVSDEPGGSALRAVPCAPLDHRTDTCGTDPA